MFERLGSRMPLADWEIAKTVDLSGYPPWLVVLGATLIGVVALWVMIKLLKFALWLALILVLIGGLGWAGWLLLN